jgi:hypothetical protein
MFQERVRGAPGEAKHRGFPDRSVAIQPHRPNSTHDCLDVIGYAKFMQTVPGGDECAMQYEFLFIFQKGIRAGIEYRV